MPPTPFEGDPYRRNAKSLISSVPGHALTLGAEKKKLELLCPPDKEMVELVEWAFLEGQIDSEKAELAYFWLSAK